MLDAFLEVLVEKEARHSAREEMADAFMAMPADELHKIASGQLKLADYDDHEWLSKFKGTPLYEPALQLEQQCLELDIQQQQQQQARQQETEQDRAIWNAKDGIRLKKRMLDLELLKMESSTEAGGNIAAGQPAPDMQQQQQQAAPQNPQGVAGAPMENAPKQASAKLAFNFDDLSERPTPKRKEPAKKKTAAELQAGQREDIKSKNFAVHPKGGEAKYPIHDASHARNALTRVRQFGTPAEKAQVFAAITKKYPALATRSDVIPEKTQAKAEKKLGLPKGGESQKKEAPKQKLGEAILAMRMEKVALSPMALHGLIGAGVGAAGGALTGGAREPGGQSHRLRNALIGAGLGAGAGVGGSALASRLGKAAPAAEQVAEHAAVPAAVPAAASVEQAAAAAPASKKVLPKGQAPVRRSAPVSEEALLGQNIGKAPAPAPKVGPGAETRAIMEMEPGSVQTQMQRAAADPYSKGKTVGMAPYIPGVHTASALPEMLAAMRMQKLAAMSPLHAANYYGDYIADAAGLGGVGGQVDPETLALMREHAMSNIAGHVAERQQAAEHAAAHPVLSRLKGGVTGGLVGGLTGAGLGLGFSGGKGIGAALGGAAGLLGGAALGQHATRPEAYARGAARAAEAHGALSDPAVNAALQREVADQHLARIQAHELEAAKSHGQYGQEARAKAKLYNTALKHGLDAEAADRWDHGFDFENPKYGSALSVADQWGRQMAAMEKEAFLGTAFNAVKGALPGILGKARSGVQQLGGGFKQLGQAAKSGWGGVVNQAGGLSTGIRGAAQNVGQTWSNIAKTSPGLAAGLVAAPVGVAAFGMGRMSKRRQQPQQPQQ